MRRSDLVKTGSQYGRKPPCSAVAIDDKHYTKLIKSIYIIIMIHTIQLYYNITPLHTNCILGKFLFANITPNISAIFVTSLCVVLITCVVYNYV